MRILSNRTVLLSLLMALPYKNGNLNFADAAKTLRGNADAKEEIEDIPTTPSSSDERTNFFGQRKTPPKILGTSKCALKIADKRHPGCSRPSYNTKPGDKTPNIQPSPAPLTSEPTRLPTRLPTGVPSEVPSDIPKPTPLPTTASPTTQSPTTPLPSMTPSTPFPSESPTRIIDGPPKCVQVSNQNELMIPMNDKFYKGDAHCIKLPDGQEAYFGYTLADRFGLFVNGKAKWEIPAPRLVGFVRWTFQKDGNMVLRNDRNQPIWTTNTDGNWDSLMRVSLEGVSIETDQGTLWTTVPPPTPAPTTSASPSTPLPTMTPTTPVPTQPPTPPPTYSPTKAPPPSPPPTPTADRPLKCVQTSSKSELTIPTNGSYRKGDLHCLRLDDGEEAHFGYTWADQFGLFVNGKVIWEVQASRLAGFDRWTFQNDGNLVLRNSRNQAIWTTDTDGNSGSRLKISLEGVWMERNLYYVWAQPPHLGPTGPPISDEYPDPNGALQYYAYYYPWYHRDNWSRHGYQDTPLLGLYGTNEVAVAEQHIQWALQTGITSWIVSWWGPSSLSMRHFKAGMLNAPSINNIKFCMLYETPILDGRGNWYDGSLENALYSDLKVIRDEFFNHPSYLRINGRPVVIFYITRSRMDFQEGFNGQRVLKNMRERLGTDIYFIADEPFFNWFNDSPEGNLNAFRDGKQVFDAYTTYNMYENRRVRDGETATVYQLREGMPIWKRWAEKVPFFPNVMAQYYDFRGHKPLLGNAADFKTQLREIACLPRKNFNGAPHIMFITSFNEWWEGTQIEPENGSSGNWNNYGFQFMDTLAEFKKEVDSAGTYWCA